jgi:hypothetical protein
VHLVYQLIIAAYLIKKDQEHFRNVIACEYPKAMSAGAHGTNATKNIFCGTAIKATTSSGTFAERCAKLTADDRMITLPGTVSGTYVKKELGHENFDYYMSKLPRWSN